MNIRRGRISLSSVALAVTAILLGGPAAPASAQSCGVDSPGSLATVPPPDGISVQGRVADASRGIPVSGARVDYSWRGPDGEEREEDTWTDPDGRFWICDVPTSTEVALSPEVGGGPGEDVETVAGPHARVDLVVPLPDPNEPSGLLGTVREADSDRAVANAEVRIPELELTTSTDFRGAFIVPEVEPGSYRIEIEHLSYGSVVDTVHLVAGRPLSARFALAPTPIRIAGVEATARSRRWLRGQADRMRRIQQGLGDYITADDIAQRNDPPLHMMLQSVAGVSAAWVSHPWGRTYYPEIRSCGVPTVYVDGARIVINPADGIGIDDFRTRNIELIEIYKGPSTTPVGYPARGGCGVILIWTHAPG